MSLSRALSSAARLNPRWNRLRLFQSSPSCRKRMNHRETSLRALKKKEFAGESEVAENQSRPAVPAIGYTGFLPGLQSTVGAPFPSLAKMSNSYCTEYNSRAREARTRHTAPRDQQGAAVSQAASPSRSVPRTTSRESPPAPKPAPKTGGYTGYRPGNAETYGVRR
jgi:hypothetical protein